jgi:hypothetical protein
MNRLLFSKHSKLFFIDGGPPGPTKGFLGIKFPDGPGIVAFVDRSTAEAAAAAYPNHRFEVFEMTEAEFMASKSSDQPVRLAAYSVENQRIEPIKSQVDSSGGSIPETPQKGLIKTFQSWFRKL